MPKYSHNACAPFTKNKERIQKFRETGDSRYIYQSDLDKTGFQQNMAYGDFKDLSRRAASVLQYYRTNHLILLKIKIMIDIKEGLSQWSKTFLIKRLPLLTQEQELILIENLILILEGELHKPAIQKFKKRKVYFFFKGNSWSADLAATQLISKVIKEFNFY